MAEPVSPDTIFCAAIEIADEAQRAAYIAGACGHDQALRERVEKLVAAHFRAGGFLEQPPQPTGAFDSATPPPRGPTAAGGPSTILGPYKLVQEIGEGGMGTVYLAQQTEPVKRLVALKVVRPGLDSRSVLARFEAERQALALMDHPNIARVLDAGSGPDGRPYFVMELVKGVPITKYCDDHRLTPRQRLELFVPVCQAVQHAHQKGIIHRDIKPSNVLVCLYDGKPVPKVIDFGIAKATGQQLTDKTLVTGFGNVVGTLEYMSPEQAELNQLDIDTRSDVYSLGVLLYELLTGSTPLDRKRLKEAALLEVLRVIREEEPPRPSTRLSTTDELPSVAANRGLDPRKLSGLVRGELDWIVMKALEKDRNRRYDTANGFAADVQRYLADEPVQACPPSAAYRVRKFARRHRAGLAVAGLVLFFLAVLGGGVAWLVSDHAARRTRATNELGLALERAALFVEQGKRAEALAALDRADLLAGEARPDPASDERRAALKERLAAEARDQEFVATFENIRLEAQSGVDLQGSHFTTTAALTPIREALRKYGIAIGSVPPSEAGVRVLGRPEAVRRNLVAALDECLKLTPAKETSAREWLLAVLAAADNDAWRAQVRKAMAVGDQKALAQLTQAVDVEKQPPSFLIPVSEVLAMPTRIAFLRRIQRAYPGDLWANHGLAYRLVKSGQAAQAVRYYTAALALRPKNPGIYLNRSEALQQAGEVEAASEDLHRALALAPQYAGAHNNLGNLLKDQGKLDEAISRYREAIRLNKDLAEPHIGLGNALQGKGQLDEAIAAYREAVRLNKYRAEAHYNLGNALRNKGKLDEAIAAYREAIRLNKDYAEAHNNLGLALRDNHNPEEAIAAFREAIRLNKDSAFAHNNLGLALRDKGRFDEAIAAVREAIRLKKDFGGAHNNLGRALWAKGQREEAAAAFREAIRLNKDDTEAHYNLGVVLRDKGQLDEAIAAYREAIRLKKDYAEAHNNLGNALRLKGRLEEAIVAFREAIRLKKDDARFHYNLGLALRARGQQEEAIAAFREAIRLQKDWADAHIHLGSALRDKEQVAEATAEFREAIRLKKDSAEAYCGLGLALMVQADFRPALEALRRGHELGSRHPRWGHPSAMWVQKCGQFLELDGRSAAILAGKAMPADAAERLALAELCVFKHLDRAACRFYEEAFDAEPKSTVAHRYQAARAAARAGCGWAKDADKVDDKERAQLRRQALTWLQAELEVGRRLVDRKPNKGPSAADIARGLQYWLADPSFVALREPKQLAQLPEAEGRSWRQLWAQVTDTLARARHRAGLKSKPDAP
jgi:tetratricopeptide (TPR) repeat protein/serine/threonine protein kinase